MSDPSEDIDPAMAALLDNYPDDDSDEQFTYHTEPASVGGARYVRCDGCGVESVPADPERILHREGCPEGDR